MISYPIRKDKTVTLVLPRDLIPSEAERVVAFIKALAIDEATRVAS